MDLSIALSLIAIFLSIVSVIISNRSLKSQITICKYAALVAQAQRNETNLFTYTKLFNLYNIDINELERKGLTPEELLYIWSDLRQGEIFHSIDGYFNKRDVLSEYRVNFLKNQKVQIAFNDFIYGQLMGKTKYTNILKEYIDSLSKK